MTSFIRSGFPARRFATALGVAWLAIIIGIASATPARAAAPPPAAVSHQTAATKTQAPPPSADFVGEETCTTCHEAQGTSLRTTLHGQAQNSRTPAATGHACETCHGPGKAHVDGSGDKSKIKVLTAMAPRDVSDTCLTCHSRNNHTQWKGGPHDSRNLSCITCHSIHSPKSERVQLKAASEIETCASCHKAQAMKVKRTSHMPVTEGKMTCTTCHNPHGSTNVKQLKVGNYLNQACVSCHAEKRGPFLHEHAPVVEGCTTCHDPHGSSNDRMLVAKAPMLCQRCHVSTRHPPTIYDGKAVTNIPTAGNRIYGRSCVNCHSQIHGSNHPSGGAFLR